MNKNYLVVGAVIVVLLLGGAAFAFKYQIKNWLMPPAPTPVEQSMPAAGSPAPVAEKEAIIEVDYTNSSFSPATATVKKRTTVKFINKSVNPMSVVSNPHPTHTDYPGLDQYKSDAKGKDEYSFVFDKVGTWGYHNHLNPSDTGTVIVTE